MSTQHVEFPGFTPETRAAFDAALRAITSTTATISLADLRRALAASLWEVMEQNRKGYGETLWDELDAIANNLHNPPRRPR